MLHVSKSNTNKVISIKWSKARITCVITTARDRRRIFLYIIFRFDEVRKISVSHEQSASTIPTTDRSADRLTVQCVHKICERG